jgi:hypothetical protein
MKEVHWRPNTSPRSSGVGGTDTCSPTTRRDWIEYEKKQFRLILGRFTRMITGTLDPHLARYPDDDWAQVAAAQLTGVRAPLAQLTK